MFGSLKAAMVDMLEIILGIGWTEDREVDVNILNLRLYPTEPGQCISKITRKLFTVLRAHCVCHMEVYHNYPSVQNGSGRQI